MRLLSRIAVDTTPLRESRDLRLLLLGNVVTGLGTQAMLVALPHQLYFSVSSGGLLCVTGAGLVVLAFPALARYDKGKALEAAAAQAEAASLARTAAYPGAA